MSSQPESFIAADLTARQPMHEAVDYSDPRFEAFSLHVAELESGLSVAESFEAHHDAAMREAELTALLNANPVFATALHEARRLHYEDQERMLAEADPENPVQQ